MRVAMCRALEARGESQEGDGKNKALFSMEVNVPDCLTIDSLDGCGATGMPATSG